MLEHYPNWAWLAKQVDHAAWEGCTFWDLIQPAFTFMVGAAISGDPVMIAFYQSGDPYLTFAKRVGAAPEWAKQGLIGEGR